MNNKELYKELSFPEGLVAQLNDYENHRSKVISSRKFLEFTKTYYPDWQNVEICTDTWMIMPELEELLPVDSKILAFKHLFDIDHVDYEQSWWMGWIYPGYSEINESLPERTTLHRNLKAHLLSGKKFGIAKGHVVLERVFD